MESIFIDKFHTLYDCFFKIIKSRLARLKHNEKGQIDELMYPEDSLMYLRDPETKTDVNKQRSKWLEDHLYLPSHITSN